MTGFVLIEKTTCSTLAFHWFSTPGLAVLNVTDRLFTHLFFKFVLFFHHVIPTATLLQGAEYRPTSHSFSGVEQTRGLN